MPLSVFGIFATFYEMTVSHTINISLNSPSYSFLS